MGGLLVAVLAVAGFVVAGAGDAMRWAVGAWWRLVKWPARRRVRLATEQARREKVAERLGELVPDQRRSPECVVIPFQRRPNR